MVRRLLVVLALTAAVLGMLITAVIPASAKTGNRASPARARPLPVLYNLGGCAGACWNLAQRRPVIFYLAADGSAALGDKAHHLKWTKWDKTSAAATGRYYYRTGPCCKYHSDAVKITANHVVRRNANKSWYDRMTIRFSKRKSVTIKYERIDGFGFWQTVAGRFP
jgi:hypothetical protein